MRFLTGKHREAYESLVEQNGRLLATMQENERLLKMLEERITELTALWTHANARAERAIDAQLSVRGFPTVTPRDGMPAMPDELAEDPEQVDALEKRLLAGDASVWRERL